MHRLFAILTLLYALSPQLPAQETTTFGTGEVDHTTLQVGDMVEITYHAEGPRSRSPLEEASGMVVDIQPTFFVVEHADDEALIDYSAVIGLDRTRSDTWTLDPLDLAISPGSLVDKYLGNRELEGLEGTWGWDHAGFGIVVFKNRAEGIPRYDYVGILTATSEPGWQSDEVKLLLKETASEETYSATFVVADKQRFGTTLQVV